MKLVPRYQNLFYLRSQQFVVCLHYRTVTQLCALTMYIHILCSLRRRNSKWWCHDGCTVTSQARATMGPPYHSQSGFRIPSWYPSLFPSSSPSFSLSLSLSLSPSSCLSWFPSLFPYNNHVRYKIYNNWYCLSQKSFCFSFGCSCYFLCN